MSECIVGHRVFIHDRGGVQRLDEITHLASCQWSRVRDDISVASVDISAMYCDSQSDILNLIEPGRHELVVYRGDVREWEGPINRISYTAQGVSIYARDVGHYLYFTVMQNGYDNSGVNSDFVTNRAYNIINTELTRRDAIETGAGLPSINVMPYVVNHHTANDARTTAKTLPMQYTVFEHIDNLAADYGMDYTTVGRAIHLWDTHRSLGQTVPMTENDFLGDLTLGSYGMELGTRAISTDGMGVWGEAGGVDSFYGLWERLTTAYDEETDEVVPTQAELESQAIRGLVNRNPTPVVLRIPDGSGLNMAGNFTMADLVPGVLIPLRATVLVREFSQMQKLDKVVVTENSQGEKVQISLVPAPTEEEV